jgi:hypothetical protein
MDSRQGAQNETFDHSGATFLALPAFTNLSCSAIPITFPNCAFLGASNMFKKNVPLASHSDVDPREAINSRRRDFLDFLVKSSSSVVALAAVGSLAACGGGDDVIAPALPHPPPPAILAIGVCTRVPI